MDGTHCKYVSWARYAHPKSQVDMANTVSSSGLFASSVLPPSSNILWYRTPGATWSKNWLPVGNGFLAGTQYSTFIDHCLNEPLFPAMTPGGTSQEITQLNIESLWSGGPFQDPVSALEM